MKIETDDHPIILWFEGKGLAIIDGTLNIRVIDIETGKSLMYDEDDNFHVRLSDFLYQILVTRLEDEPYNLYAPKLKDDIDLLKG